MHKGFPQKHFLDGSLFLNSPYQGSPNVWAGVLEFTALLYRLNKPKELKPLEMAQALGGCSCAGFSGSLSQLAKATGYAASYGERASEGREFNWARTT